MIKRLFTSFLVFILLITFVASNGIAQGYNNNSWLIQQQQQQRMMQDQMRRQQEMQRQQQMREQQRRQQEMRQQQMREQQRRQQEMRQRQMRDQQRRQQQKNQQQQLQKQQQSQQQLQRQNQNIQRQQQNLKQQQTKNKQNLEQNRKLRRDQERIRKQQVKKNKDEIAKRIVNERLRKQKQNRLDKQKKQDLKNKLKKLQDQKKKKLLQEQKKDKEAKDKEAKHNRMLLLNNLKSQTAISSGTVTINQKRADIKAKLEKLKQNERKSGKNSGNSPPDKRVQQLEENKKTARDFEKKVKNQVTKEQTGVVEQVTMRAKNGVKTRVDLLGRDSDGKVKCTECKSSETAPLTKNQKLAFPDIEKNGAVIVGKGKPGFEGGTVIPPTKIDIIRPKDSED
ncbi:MAG: hypothetical protein R3D71_10175 [Rickettsiales bacterium]